MLKNLFLFSLLIIIYFVLLRNSLKFITFLLKIQKNAIHTPMLDAGNLDPQDAIDVDHFAKMDQAGGLLLIV